MKLTIGVQPFEGDYTLDLADQPLDLREYHVIKQVSGIRGAELTEALNAGDTDVLVALAVITLIRAGKITDKDVAAAADSIYTATAKDLVFDFETSEEEQVPPPSGADEKQDGAENPNTSGASSNTGSANPAPTHTPTGALVSA